MLSETSSSMVAATAPALFVAEARSRTIFESKTVLLLASGTNKAGAVAAAVEDEVSESMPASMLRSHPNAVLFLDEAAASDLGHGVAG